MYNVAAGVACALVLALVVLPGRRAPGRLLRFLETRVLIAAGLISYPAFLWHEPLLRWLRRPRRPVQRDDQRRLAGGDSVAWEKTSPQERRHGTDRLLRTILEVADAHAAANPDAPRLAVGDLSRPEGGSFDARHGILEEFGTGGGALGHVSHQNGLDVDVYYPRKDGRERGPGSLDQVDLGLSQDIVDRFVAAGAQLVLVGPRTGLTGPPGVVAPARRHDDHMHVRLPPAG